MSGTRVLCVEDSEMVGRFLVDALRFEGIEAVLAADADAAIAVLESEDGKFDLVLCDYMLPGMTGLDLMKAIRERYAHLPLVLTTGFADENVERAAVSFDGLLNKPFEVSDIIALIAKLKP